MSSRVILVRHGETDFNAECRFLGSIDRPLSERGLEQVSFLQQRMKHTHFDRIYTSPYTRARQTALAMQAGRNIEIIDDDGLREICCGEWEGLNGEQVETRWPGMLKLWNEQPDKIKIPSGDTLHEVSERINEAFWRLVRKERGKVIGIASHMICIELLLMRQVGAKVGDIWKQKQLDNTSVSVIDVDDNDNTHIISWGDNSHLPPELRCSVPPVAGRHTPAVSTAKVQMDK
ncbi:MAG: histidine phosphatase family protein [Bacillota bacterium]|jgi:broad specificity phosphatase PhoE